MSENQNYDVIVVGGGPGGYVAGIRAAQLGLKTAVIERAALGGVCLNWGCIPTKSLLRNAEVINLLGEGKEYGFSVENVTVDYAAAQKRSRQVSARLVKGISTLFRKNGVTHIEGTATLVDTHRVQVAPSGEMLEARNIIIATGASSRSLPGMQVDGVKIITSREALELTVVPKRLVVVGAGAIGMEFAYLFRSYGAEVAVIEMLPHVLPLEDEDTAAEVARAFKKQGIVAAEHIAGHETRPIREADYAFMPRATYCHPQVASLGLTEAQAREKGYEVKIGKFPFLANGKALGLNEKDGFVKIISDARYGEILGAHLVGPEVTELLPELALAHTWELTAEEIARTVHAHPTLSEVLMEAAHAVEGQAIHI